VSSSPLDLSTHRVFLSRADRVRVLSAFVLTETSKLKTGELFSDSTTQKEEVSVASLEAQGEWESRRLWKEAADGIKTGDFDRASREKTKIEVRLRLLSFDFLWRRGSSSSSKC